VDCDAVIHLIGQQTSATARPRVNPPSTTSLQRHSDFGVIVGLKEDELRTLSYTQWQAWLALYHRKTKRPDLRLIIVAKPTAAFAPDDPADVITAAQQQESQHWHEKELQKRGRYSEIDFEDRKVSPSPFSAPLRTSCAAVPQRIAQTRLISRHTAADFLGRDKELALLDDAWAGTTDLPSSNSDLRRPLPPVNLLPSSPGAAWERRYWHLIQSRFMARRLAQCRRPA